MSRQRKGTSNININISLKLSSKSELAGKKITNSKQISHNHQHEMMRSNVTTHTLNRAKQSFNDHPKHKSSLNQFIEEHTLTYEHPQQPLSNPQQPTSNQHNHRKKMKSKSLQNLKIRYYEKTPEIVKKELKQKDKSKSKSKSKSKIQVKNESPSSITKSKSHSKKRKHLQSESKSKSKSPPVLHKKKSLQIFKAKQSDNKQRAFNKKVEKVKQKGLTFKKSFQYVKQKINTQQSSANTGKKMSQKIKSTRKSSLGRLKPPTRPKQQDVHKKVQKKSLNKAKPKRNANKQRRIYPEQFKEKMAIKIQRVWRGFMVRKRLNEELNMVSHKIKCIKNEMASKNSKFWDERSNQSNHSIERLEKIYPIEDKQEQAEVFSKEGNEKITLQLEILRKRLQDQEDRFKRLAQENNELKAAFNHKQILQTQAKYQKHSKDQRKAVYLRMESEQSERDAEQKGERLLKKRQIMQQLPAAIKTQQSNLQSSELDFATFKKKTQIFQCSPKSTHFTVNKQIIKKLYLKQQQKLNNKYFKQNIQHQQLLQNKMVSPKSYQFKRIQLQKHFQLQKSKTLHKFKEAEKALLLISQIEEENNTSLENINDNIQTVQKEAQNGKPGSNQSGKFPADKQPGRSPGSKQSGRSPGKKLFNLYINVDEMQLQSNKYGPILSSHSHRECQHFANGQDEKEMSNLSNQYKKIMDDRTGSKIMDERIGSKKSDVYLEEQVKEDHFFNFSKNQAKSQPSSSHQQQIAQSLQDRQENRSVAQGPKGKKGFDTNLRYLRGFYINFCEYIRSISYFKEELVQNLSSEIKFDSSLFLKTFRNRYFKDEYEELVFPYFKLLAEYNNVIPSHILNSYYEELGNADSPYFSKECYDLKQASRQQYHSYGFSYYEMKQHHDLALIDAFNESLNQERPGGEQGSNLEFITQKYYNINQNKIISKFNPDVEQDVREEQLDILLGNSIGTVINNWASMLCGFINQQQNQEQRIDEARLQQIRSIRQSIMLEKHIKDQEKTLTSFQLFDLATRYELAQKIQSLILEQTLSHLYQLTSKATK